MGRSTLLVLFLYFTSGCFSQESYLRHYSTNEGLPSTETYWATQDRKGYIWIASDMGVSRFDGYKFRVYTTADGLTDNTIFRFYEDYKGRIWFYTFSGKLCYYFNDAIYGKGFAVNNKIRDFLGTDIMTGINIDRGDTILMSTTKGLLRIIPEHTHGNTFWNKMEVVANKKSYLLNRGYATVEKKDGNKTLYIQHRMIDRIGPDLSSPQSTELTLPFPFKDFIEPAEYRNEGMLLLYTNTSILMDTSRKLHHFGNLQSAISNFQESDTSIWLGMKHGGVGLYIGNDLLRPIKTLLKSFSVTCIMKDLEGGYWFTTLEDGLFYLPSGRFTYFEKTLDPCSFSFSTFSENLLYKLADGKILGLNSKKVYDINKPEAESTHTILSQYNYTEHDAVWNVSEDSDKEIWISTSSGISVYDPPGEKLLDRIYFPPSYTDNDSRSIIEDRDHNIWSLNHSSITKISHSSKKIIKTILIPSRAETACEDHQGNILIGTVNGLYRLTRDTLVYMGLHNELFKSRFVDIKISGEKIICATRGAGVVVIDGDSLHQISMVDGLMSNMCRSIYVDERNVIWVSTNNGLNSIRIREYPFKYLINSFSTSDGLLSNDNDQVLKNAKIVWLLSKKGITAFDPNEAIRNNIPPPVYITNVMVNNISHPPGAINELDYATNFMEVDFVGLTYKNAGKQYYKYKLEGYDTTLTYTQNTFVQFTKLPPGDYKLEVWCINNSGLESRLPAILNFKVNTPFYQKLWFNFFLSLMIIITVIFMSLFYIRRIRKNEAIKTEINRKIANLELQALHGQMNPHFIFNCLNAIQDFILKNDSVSAKHYLSSFSKLIRKTLDNSRKSSIILADEINFLIIYLDLERMRFSDKFNYRINIDDSVDKQYVSIPTMILQPFIENSIRHGKIGSLPIQGELAITFLAKENTLICKIEDNGIGFKNSINGKGRGLLSDHPHALEIINGRIRTLNEINKSNIWYIITDKSDIDIETQGTEVSIHIPI